MEGTEEGEGKEGNEGVREEKGKERGGRGEEVGDREKA